MKLFGREPVAWVGIIASIAIAIITTLAGESVISDVAAGRAIDAVDSLQSVALIFLPLILNVVLARPATTPVVDPALPVGTTVTVYQPGVSGSGQAKVV